MDYSFLDQFSLLWCSLGGDNFYIWMRRRGGLSLCGCSSLPPRSPPWSTAPITIPSSHTWTLRCGILDDEHWCFFDRYFIARCQQSMPCLFWSPVPYSNTCTLMSNADVTCLFWHWQGKILVAMMVVVILFHWCIQQKTIIHTQCAENYPNGNSSPSMTNVRGNNRKPKCTPCSQPPFLQWLNQRFANISSPDDKSNHWPPLHESAGWLSQRSSIVNQKVYPAFRLHGKRTVFEGRMKNITKVDRALDVIRLDCLTSQSIPTP